MTLKHTNNYIILKKLLIIIMKELHISGTHAKNSVGWFYFSENSQILNVMYIRIIIPPNLQIVQMYLYVCYRECE